MGNRFSTSLHESAHSLMRLWLDGVAVGAAINPDEGAALRGWSGGDLDTVPTPEDFTPEKAAERSAGLSFEAAFREAAVFEAGHAATAVYNRKAYLPLVLSGGDVRESMALAQAALPSGDTATFNGFVATAHAFAGALLARRFNAVLHVAGELERRGRMTGSEIAAAYAAALRAEGAGAAEAEGGGNGQV